jgi:WD40-like Beta Propeller Repeat
MRLMHGMRLILATATVAAMLAMPVAGAAARDPAGIAFRCGRNTLDLCLVRPDGTGRRQLTRGDVLVDIPFGQISRAASLVAFIHKDRTIRVRTLGGRRVAKIVTRWRDPQTVELNRSGTRLLYTDSDIFDRTSVCTLRLGTRGRSCFQSFRAYHAWGPGGTIVSTEQLERSDICVEKRAKPCARRIAESNSPGGFFGPSALSPDGRRLAVTEEILNGPADAHVVTFDARTGRRLRTLTTGHSDSNPTWSPDGRSIVFDRDAVIRAPRPNTQVIFASLWRVSSHGGRPRRVTRRGYQPAWAS